MSKLKFSAAIIGVALASIAIAQPSFPPPPTPVSLPTAKEQCYNGGWQTFKVFKNQGDCVSYVATKGKNPPTNPVPPPPPTQ